MITLLVFVFLALLSLKADATPPDDALNAAYKQALARCPVASAPVQRESLQWTEQHWILYRDAEANLQAWIAGKTHADEAARRTALDAETKTRTAELKHIAEDGASGDLSKPATMGSNNGVAVSEDAIAMTQTYTALKDGLSHRHNPNLLAALILSQRAWLEFSDLQAGDDSYGGRSVGQDMPDSMGEAAAARLQRQRIAQLQADAVALGLTLNPTAYKNEEDNFALFTEVSPDQSIRIEQTDGDGVVALATVVSNETGSQTSLPVGQDEKGVGRGKPTVGISEFSISPDSNWIFRTQKFYHGMCGAYLYRKLSGLTYRPATHEPFDILAWKFFEETTGMQLPDVKGGGVVRWLKWHAGQLRFSLNAKDTLNSGWIADWQADYNLTKGTFSLPAELSEHDRQAIGH